MLIYKLNRNKLNGNYLKGTNNNTALQMYSMEHLFEQMDVSKCNEVILVCYLPPALLLEAYLPADFHSSSYPIMQPDYHLFIVIRSIKKKKKLLLKVLTLETPSKIEI